MTPSEKAAELLNRYVCKIGGTCEHDSYCKEDECMYNGFIVCKVDKETAKACAIICADEILESNNELFQDGNKDQYLSFGRHSTYWKSVKEEIQKL